MPDKVKKLVRARMQKAGETYQTALHHVRAQAPTTPTAGETIMYVKEANIIAEALEARISGKAEAVAGPGPTATVRYYVERAPIVFNAILFNGKIMTQAMTEPQGGIIWGVKEYPLTEDGALRAADYMIAWLSKQIDTAGSAETQVVPQSKGTPPLPPELPPRVPGELIPLTFTCLLCQTPRDLPLHDFASGTISCPNHDPPREFTIPNNARYQRLAHEIGALNARHDGVTVGLIAIGTEPYLVLHRSPRVEVAHVDTWKTRRVAVGHWNGPGNALGWERPVSANIAAGVLLWLEKNGSTAA